MTIPRLRTTTIAMLSMALALVACGGADDSSDPTDDDVEEPADIEDAEDGTQDDEDVGSDDADGSGDEGSADGGSADEDGSADEGSDDGSSDDDGEDEGSDGSDDDDTELAEGWDPDAPVRVTYRYEADFHESDEPATMILARDGGDQSLQWEQAGIRAHVNPDAEEPFTCTAQDGGDWECFGGQDPPEGYQLERSYLGEDQDLVDALTDDGSDADIAGRPARCAEVDDDGFEGTLCADVETGVLLRMEGQTPDGAVSAEATEWGEPTVEDFEAPAEIQTL